MSQPPVQRTYETDSIAVHWESSRCIHTARCLQALPQVFDARRRPWIDVAAAGAEAVAEAVRACPTGALRYTRRDDGPQEEPQRPAVAVPIPDGPLLVMGDLCVQNPEGETITRETRLTLCRCGRSRNQPFCDNSHLAGGFESREFAPKPNAPAPPGPQADAEPTTVTATRDGSLHFEGHVVVMTQEGETLADSGDVWLCRCGRSGRKPFCDGSHKGQFTSRLAEVDGERRRAETPAAFESNPGVQPPEEVEELSDLAVTDNAEAERYEIRVDGSLAGFAEYRGHTDTRTFTHTEIDERYEGQGLGGELVKQALDDVRRQGVKVIPMCPFVKAYMGKHPETLDLVDPRIRQAFGL